MCQEIKNSRWQDVNSLKENKSGITDHTTEYTAFLAIFKRDRQAQAPAGTGNAWVGIVPVVAVMSRHEPVVTVRAGPSRLVHEPA